MMHHIVLLLFSVLVLAHSSRAQHQNDLLSFKFDFPLKKQRRQDVEVAYPQHHTHHHDQRYLVLHLHSLGLANRLRTIADFYTISIYSGRTLLLSWVPSIDCNTTFTNLFQSGPNYFKVLVNHLPRNEQNAINYVSRKARMKNLTFGIYDAIDNDENDNDSYFASSTIFDSNVDIVYTHYWGSTALKHLSCQHFMISKSNFYQKLIPVNDIQDVVDDVVDMFLGKIMIGVHIRGYDANYDWAVGT